MLRQLLLSISIFISVCLSNNPAKADVMISDSAGRIMLGQQLWILQSKNELAFRDVVNSADFKKYDKDVPNLGISATSTWIRFTVKNQNENPDLLLEVAYPILDEVELFTPGINNRYSSILLGEVKKFDFRKYKHPNYIFDLTIPPGTSKTYYLRVKSAEQLIVPISINQATSLWQYLSKENLLSGIFLGAVVIMFLYNLFIFFSVKDRSYIYYVIYVGSVGFTQIGIKGYTFQYLWPNSPAFELKSVIVFACVSGIAALLFSKNFLLTRQKAPSLDVVLTLIICLLSAALILTLAGFIQIGFQLMQISTTFFAVGILIVSGTIMKRGYAPAQFVFYSWSVLLMGAIIFALKDYGILPYNTFTSYSMQGASVIEMALLSFGLADRINVLKKEKELTQAEALKIAKENERIIREQNVLLEQKVNERTFKLKESNDELNKTLDDLKQAQTQLVESEKMASLGQLTAGIAHEINNPINFVTSNVNPLKRDIDILMDVLKNIEEVGLSETSVSDKQKKIETFKEDTDFDYLKIEIDHLLKGIKEGANRTAEIVKGLRVFSRLDDDDLKRADINEGLDSTLVIANNLLSNISVVKNYGEIPLIECYPGKLNQVFMNIIANAAYAVKNQYGEAPGGQITISTFSTSKSIVIKIADNGIGMDEKTKTKIFEPFFTTKAVGEGTGLGMSITYTTIKKHHGSISLESEPGKGAEFTIELPVIHEIVTT